MPAEAGSRGSLFLEEKVKSIALFVMAAGLTFVSGASGQTPDYRSTVTPEPGVTEQVVRVPTSKKVRLPPLVLPNTAALTKALMKADRKTVAEQQVASARVLAFFNGKGRWLRAPRAEKCWQVPWQRSCTIARHTYRMHEKLGQLATQRLRSELPQPNDWVTAVRVIQRVFPNTESWLLSCSAAEGGHGRWVRFGGGSYYPGYEYTDAVGGWPQYRWSTFKGHYRNGLAALRARGFNIDMPEPNDVQAWLLPMGHAIAAGWARWSGNDDSHWSASWGNGC